MLRSADAIIDVDRAVVTHPVHRVEVPVVELPQVVVILRCSSAGQRKPFRSGRPLALGPPAGHLRRGNAKPEVRNHGYCANLEFFVVDPGQ